MTLLDTIVHALTTSGEGEKEAHRVVLRHEAEGDNWPSPRIVSDRIGGAFVNGSAATAFWSLNGVYVHGVTCSRPSGLLGRRVDHIYDSVGVCPSCDPDFWTIAHQCIYPPPHLKDER